jgi:hypothetical protein
VCGISMWVVMPLFGARSFGLPAASNPSMTSSLPMSGR